MAHISLSTTKTKYADYTNSNRIFLNNMARHRKETECIDVVVLRKRMESVSVKLKELSTEEREEWIEIQQGKVKELYAMLSQKSGTVSISKQSKSEQYGKALREALHVLVGVCQQNSITYDSSMLAKIIQGFYFGEYKDQVLQQMQDAGYSTSQFKVLHYEESSFFNSLCCCWDPSSRVE